MDRKTFVIDTNVLLHDPAALFCFSHHKVVIPVTVLEELDKMKRLVSELGKNARQVFRSLDELANRGTGDLHDGVKLENGGEVVIFLEIKQDFRHALSPAISDNRILLSACLLQERGERVVFVSKDFAARIKAEAIGLQAQDYRNLKFSYDTLYQGIRHIPSEKTDIDLLIRDNCLPIPVEGLRPNEYLILEAPENSSTIARHDFLAKQIVKLPSPVSPWGLKPRNIQQRCALDALLREEIKLITLVGPAGTGKTLLALASALHLVFDEGSHNKIVITRPIVPLGRDIGYLPGSKEEKFYHWMQAIYDNLEFLCDSNSKKNSSETLRWVLDSDKVELEAVTYIRGRSVPKAILIIDEAQNLTPHEIKTIISRAGEGTKVILTGDPTQIDNPYLDKDSNGLTYLIGKFAEEPLYAHLFLSHTERSELAARAAALL